MVFEALKSCSNLKNLVLEWNNLGNQADGVESLFSLLQTNNSIEHVDLKNNKIGGEE